MRVTDYYKNAKETGFSFEIIPPARGKSSKEITDVVAKLVGSSPFFIDVTSHSAETHLEEMNNGLVKKSVRKKRPGTIGICGVINNRYNVDTVAHLLCSGFSKRETEDALIELSYLGIENVLALKGDGKRDKAKKGSGELNGYAVDLVKQIVDLRKGRYLEEIDNSEPIDFCVGVAGYPEKHFSAPNLKTDIIRLKEKVDAGADYIITQMFFDNDCFYRFKELCIKNGITVPIIPGIKILNHCRQLSTIPSNFYIDIPEQLADNMMDKPDDCVSIGIDWARKQSEDLMKNGEKLIHYFVMNDAASVLKVVDVLK